MNQSEILKVLFDEANKPIDKSTEYSNGRSAGKMQAYSHAYILVRNLDYNGLINLLMSWEKFKKENWWESASVDVENVLMKQFEEIINNRK